MKLKEIIGRVLARFYCVAYTADGYGVWHVGERGLAEKHRPERFALETLRSPSPGKYLTEAEKTAHKVDAQWKARRAEQDGRNNDPMRQKHFAISFRLLGKCA